MNNVINDAWETWKTYFRKTINPKINKKEFYSLLNRPIKIRLKNIIQSKIENLNYKRLTAKTPKTAYPFNQRPRGNRDISSVEWHIEQLRKKNPILPIIIIKTRDSHNKQHTILLDGMHRLVASVIAKRKTIPTIVLNYDKIHKKTFEKTIELHKGGNNHQNEYYAITFSDIDAPSKATPINADWLHYLEINHLGSPDFENIKTTINAIKINQSYVNDRIIMPYASPSPPKGSGPHRYILKIWKQPKYLTNIAPIFERSKFKTVEFANKNDWNLIKEQTIVVEYK